MAGVRERLAAERERLRVEAGLPPRGAQYRLPRQRPFTAPERHSITILLGGLTPIHDRLITAVFESCGYRAEHLPPADLDAFEFGRQYGNVGQCNPAYFTIGNLIKHLQGLEAQGLTREQIVDRYVFYTSGTCGPCRFGMYEAEYHLALRNAGFDGFRVLTFQQNDGTRPTGVEPGLDYSVHFGMTALNAFNWADALNDSLYRVRPFEAREGEANRGFADALEILRGALRDLRPFDILEHVPGWLGRPLAARRLVKDIVNRTVKIRQHLRGRHHRAALAAARARLGDIEIDRLRVKPVVRITGEFWAATTEGAGNFDMFRFLEREGAEVRVDPIGAWVMYLLYQAREKARLARRAGTKSAMASAQKQLLFEAGQWFWAREYHRVVGALGGIAGPLVSQQELARLAHPFYHSMARGGEGHLEVGKTIYYTTNHHCHMVVSLKPFGCLPSTQSDGVQSSVAARLKDLIFVSVETAGDGALYAYSRVQMALAEAKAAARREFDESLARTGRTLEQIRAYVASRPELRRATYHVPSHPGVAGSAANFVLHVGALMDGAQS